MKSFLKREDDYLKRREHLKNLTDNQIDELFWELTTKVVTPLIDLSKEYTSPSIERAILLRMGFSSLEAKPLVEKAIKENLISKGVGHLVYIISKEKKLTIREAGLALIEGNYWEELQLFFKGD